MGLDLKEGLIHDIFSDIGVREDELNFLVDFLGV